MLNIIHQKYPAPSPVTRSLTTATLFGVFIALFLVFFEPFDIDLSTDNSKVYQLLFYGVISTVVLIVFLYLLPLLLPNLFSDNHWTVKHQIIFYFIILFVIATGNGLYTNYINSLPFTWSNYWWIISRTFVLGGIPISFLTLIDYQRKSNYNISQVPVIHSSLETAPTTTQDTQHHFSTDLKEEQISFKEEDFLYALAVGNYIDVHYHINGDSSKVTYRLTLSSFESQVEDSINLIRCHRSYVVNLKKVEHITGNAQGLKLELKEQSAIVPVSRKYIATVRAFFIKNS